MQADPDIRCDANEIDCAVCGSERVVVDVDGTVCCPACDESYSLVVHEEFTLLEADGWITQVSVDGSDDSVPGTVDG